MRMMKKMIMMIFILMMTGDIAAVDDLPANDDDDDADDDDDDDDDDNDDDDDDEDDDDDDDDSRTVLSDQIPVVPSDPVTVVLHHDMVKLVQTNIIAVHFNYRMQPQTCGFFPPEVVGQKPFSVSESARIRGMRLSSFQVSANF